MKPILSWPGSMCLVSFEKAPRTASWVASNSMKTVKSPLPVKPGTRR